MEIEDHGRANTEVIFLDRIGGWEPENFESGRMKSERRKLSFQPEN